MSAATTAVAPPAARWSPAVHVTFPHVVLSEWRKLTTLRSTWWTLGVFAVVHAVFGAILGFSARTLGENTTAELPDASQLAAAGVAFSQLALVVLAVLTITAEYSSGQIRNTLMAVPTRVPVLLAKTVVLAVVTFVVAAGACAASLGLGLLTAGEYVSFDLSTEQTAWQLVAGPLYLVGIVVFSFAVAALIRNSAAAIAVIMALLVVVETVLSQLPWYLTKVISPWFPGTAGQQMFRTDADLEALRAERLAMDHPGAVFTQWEGFAVVLAWALLFWVLAAVLLRRRDA